MVKVASQSSVLRDEATSSAMAAFIPCIECIHCWRPSSNEIKLYNTHATEWSVRPQVGAFLVMPGFYRPRLVLQLTAVVTPIAAFMSMGLCSELESS